MKTPRKNRLSVASPIHGTITAITDPKLYIGTSTSSTLHLIPPRFVTLDWTRLRSLSDLLVALNGLDLRVKEGTPEYERLKHLVAE